MLSEREIRERLVRYIDGLESVNDFANWLSQESSSIRFQDNAEFHLSASIQNSLEDYFNGHIDEPSLKNEVRLLIAPDQVQERTIHFVFEGDPLQPPPISPNIKPSVSSVVEVGVAAFA